MDYTWVRDCPMHLVGEVPLSMILPTQSGPLGLSHLSDDATLRNGECVPGALSPWVVGFGIGRKLHLSAT